MDYCTVCGGHTHNGVCIDCGAGKGWQDDYYTHCLEDAPLDEGELLCPYPPFLNCENQICQD